MDRRYQFVYGGKSYHIPVHMRMALDLYVNRGVHPGDFLTAVICNDLKEAIGRADEENMENLPAYVNFFYNYTPSNCWGSRKKMEGWIEHHRRWKEGL